MKNLIFQVVSSKQPHDWIIRYKNFDSDNISELSEYVIKEATDGDVNEIKISRWNKVKGGRD
jgi:hypothetical protein